MGIEYIMEDYLKGKNGKAINVDYANLPIEMKRRIDYTAITIIEIKVDDEKNKFFDRKLK